ncbi:hypothetical protein [Marivirga arenosa]|uniref:Uncharacterized protein n=1 Tax=Marivirga arenosa TaxID=3059076 RepID=A0AA52EY24_9BACT|nr:MULTISPECIES: hypothetical protein [unclassified Marivirga]WMN07933.1 hypothetical protein QYS48_30415 [Marivirga sp. ABR2-2]WNB17856.1 hypothetical protein QYS47_28365 [Marivirga sp. BKB1-2]
MILSKVRFSKKLFTKEFRKTKQWLTVDEHEELKNWLRKDRSYRTPSLK